MGSDLQVDAGALSAVPAAGDRRAARLPALLTFFHGPMDCGKSTLALQIDYNHARQGRCGLLLTKLDRSGDARISSRIGLGRTAIEMDDKTDLRELVRSRWAVGERVDYVLCDEAQFATEEQVEQMADLVDHSCVDVYAFGLATDFRGRLFPGSQRLFELADELIKVQVEVLCWCGRRGQLNARVCDGRVVREGEQVVVADTVVTDTVVTDTMTSDAGVTDTVVTDTVVTDAGASPPVTRSGTGTADEPVRYQVLCRYHYRLGDLGPAAPAAGQLPLLSP